MIASPGSLALALLVGGGGLVGTGVLAVGLGWITELAVAWCGF